MTDRERNAGFDDLERHLALLADDVAFPATPSFDLALTTSPSGREAPPPAPRRLPTRAWQAGLAAAVVLLLTTLAIPTTRETLGSWFSFPGIRIEVGDRGDDPSPTVTSIGDSLLLGNATPLEEASERAGFPVLVPASGLVAEAPEAWLNNVQGTAVVSLLYPATDDLPSIGTTGVGLLLMQIDAGGETGMFIVKRATGETPPQPVVVNGQQGLWVQGGVLMTDAGDPFWTYLRRSGNVLVWEQDGITYRMESDLPLEDALAIAESLTPVEE
jgi:hypothetical protein